MASCCSSTIQTSSKPVLSVAVTLFSRLALSLSSVLQWMPTATACIYPFPFPSFILSSCESHFRRSRLDHHAFATSARGTSSALRMSQPTDDTATQRCTHCTRPTGLADEPRVDSSPLSSSSAASATSSSNPSTSNWAQLPTELLALVASYASFTAMQRLSVVSRRLQQLVEPSSRAIHSPSIWRHYPPVTFLVDKRIDSRVVIERTLEVGDERLGCTHLECSSVSSCLSLLRHVTALRLGIHLRYTEHCRSLSELPFALLASLQRFTQLRSLELRDFRQLTEESLVAALDSLPSLVSLERQLVRVGGKWQADRHTAPPVQLATAPPHSLPSAAASTRHTPAVRSHASPHLTGRHRKLLLQG